MRKLFAFLAATAALIVASPAAAVTLVTDGVPFPGTPKLLGATGVNVGGSLYDVQFLTGSCISNFSGCDAASDFQFSSYLSASVAGQALLDQVFVGSYDSEPARTIGCLAGFCDVFIPYGVAGVGTAQWTMHAALAENAAGTTTDVVINYPMSPAVNQNGTIFARFTLSAVQPAAVPEPATWGMMLLGFGGIGFQMRRRQKLSRTLFAYGSRRVARKAVG